MRPGARGFLEVMIGLVVAVCGFTWWALRTEFWTLGQNDPISHFLSDMPKIGVALTGMGFGMFVMGLFAVALGLLIHAHWPAKSRWKKQDDEIAKFGDPDLRLPGIQTPGQAAYRHAASLWRLHTGGS